MGLKRKIKEELNRTFRRRLQEQSKKENGCCEDTHGNITNKSSYPTGTCPKSQDPVPCEGARPGGTGTVGNSGIKNEVKNKYGVDIPLEESIRRGLNYYGTRDEERGRRLDEQWSGVVGDPCCPVHARPGHPGWFAINHYDNAGNPCTGGCGEQKEPMIGAVDEGVDLDYAQAELDAGKLIKPKVSPYWCCEWDIITY